MTDFKKHDVPLQLSDEADNPVYPELDMDGNHVHVEMVPAHGDALMWLTVRREITPELASATLRKIADMIDHHGTRLLDVLEGQNEPLRLGYDEHGNFAVRD